MSLPYYKFVPITASVQSTAFASEKKHMLLAMNNNLIGSDTPWLIFSGASALTDFKKYFGDIPEYQAVSKYFNFLSKTGTSPEKLIVARWYKEAAASFIKGTSTISSITELKAINNGSFKMSFNSNEFEVVVDLSAITSYSDVATILQNAIQKNTSGGSAYTEATVSYSMTTGGFIIVSGETGSLSTTDPIIPGTTGTDVSTMLGLVNAQISQGVNAETYQQFCDRMLNANSSGYSITTIEDLDENSIQESVKWLQGLVGSQTIYSVIRLVFNVKDKTTAKAIQSTLSALNYTGYVVCWDPNSEYVNILDCAICASIDPTVSNGSINFNFQPATGYTSVTTLGTVVNYQQGVTNLSLTQELDNLCISYIYSVGFGEQEEVLYGMGLMQGAFRTEDVQVNESVLENDIQTRLMNGFISLNKLKLQGSDAVDFISSTITPAFEQAKKNGSIAQNGSLSETDKNKIYQMTGNESAAECVETNGYYYQVQPLTPEDIANNRARIIVAYLCGGVINQVRFINYIFGA